MPYRSKFPTWYSSLSAAERAHLADLIDGPLPGWLADSLTAAEIPLVECEIDGEPAVLAPQLLRDFLAVQSVDA